MCYKKKRQANGRLLTFAISTEPDLGSEQKYRRGKQTAVITTWLHLLIVWAFKQQPLVYYALENNMDQ